MSNNSDNIMRRAGAGIGSAVGAFIGLGGGLILGGFALLTSGSITEAGSRVESAMEKCAEEGKKIGHELAPSAVGIAASLVIGGIAKGGSTRVLPK